MNRLCLVFSNVFKISVRFGHMPGLLGEAFFAITTSGGCWASLRDGMLLPIKTCPVRIMKSSNSGSRERQTVIANTLLIIALLLMTACVGQKGEEYEQRVISVDTTQIDSTNIVIDVNQPPKITDMKTHNTEVAFNVTKYRRSPINVTTPGEKMAHNLEFKYVSAQEVIKNLGHTVELADNKGNELWFNGRVYRLVQFHFQAIADHKINGDEYPMEMYLVHRGADSTYLVVSLLFVEGEENTFLKTFISDIPKKAVDTTEAKKEINLKNLLPRDERFYTYAGSSATPPYATGVRWLIFRQPVNCSREQITILKKIIGSNARNLQPMNLRKIEEF